jgi:glycosyltransferase involved in cell wall biosynthesis
MSAPERTPEVSVVVPVHDGAAELPALFAALGAQTAPRERFEVLVVDDGSTDATPALVEASAIARLVRTEGRQGSYAARNRALEVARGELVAFTDADCRPDPTWIERGIAAMAASGADLLAGRIDLPLGPRPPVAAVVDAARHLDQERYAKEGFGATANLWARRDAFRRFGGFDGSLRAGGDAEFGRRAVRAGATLRFAPDVLVRHPPRADVRELSRKAFRVGHGHAERIYRGEAFDGRPLLWALHPGMWIPSRRIEGLGRLRQLGHEPRGRERVAVLVAQWALGRLPMLLGNLASVLEHRRLPERW